MAEQADAGQVAGQWADQVGGWLRQLLPQLGMVDPQEMLPAVGEVIGPAVDLWTGPKPVGEKLERTGREVGKTLASLVGGAGAALMGHSGDAEAAIRRGGDPSLAAIHQMGLGKLMPWLQNGVLPREVYSPSVAINKNEIPQNFGEVTLVMRPDALDPKRVPAELWNRDAYTPRTHSYAGTFREKTAQELKKLDDYAALGLLNPDELANARRSRLRDDAGRRLQDRFAPEQRRVFVPGSLGTDVRMLEGASTSLDYGHLKSILASPSMKSFEEFEKAPRGAKLLGTGTDPRTYSDKVDENFAKGLEQAAKRGNDVAQNALQRRLYTPGNLVNAWDGLLRGITGGEMRRLTNKEVAQTEELAQMINQADRAYAHSPSDYAELKVRGPVRMDASNWVGAVMDAETANQYLPQATALKQLLQQRGIPLTFAGDKKRLEEKVFPMSNGTANLRGW